MHFTPHPHHFPLPLRQQAQSRLVQPVPTRPVSTTQASGGLAPMPSGGAPLRRICTHNNSHHFCCLPGLPGPRRGSGHSSPTALALAFCCSSSSSLGGSSGRSRASPPVLRACCLMSCWAPRVVRRTQQSVLSCPLWPCTHRMCVIAKETGLSPIPMFEYRSLQKTTIQKIGDNFS